MPSDALRVVVTGGCPHCRAMLAVNRVEAQAFCGVCGRETTIAQGTWSRLLREAIVASPGLRPGTTRGATADGWSLQYRRIALGCLTCGRPIAVDDERCVPCGTRLDARRVRDTACAELIPEISHFYGETPARGAANDAADARPYPCDGCGAALPLLGNEQTLTCSFCSRVTHVPLRFLYRGHRDVPEPFGLVFAKPLAEPDDADTALGDLFEWHDPATEVPLVLPLGEGRVLIAGSRRSMQLGRDHDIEQVETRFLLVLEASKGLSPSVVWTRSDLRLAAPTERRPFTLSPGYARLLVRTDVGIYTLDARTGDTLTVAPLETLDREGACDFRRASVELPGEGRRSDDQRLAVGDDRHLLSYALREDPRRLLIEVQDLEGNKAGPSARGEHEVGDEDELDDVCVSLAAGRVVVGIGARMVLTAKLGSKLRFERVALPAGRRPARVVAFGEGLAVITDRGGFRAFDTEGKLQFDAATLPRTKKKSAEQLAIESGNAIMREAMDDFAVVQAKQFAADAEREGEDIRKRFRLLWFIFGGMAATMIAIVLVVLLAVR